MVNMAETKTRGRPTIYSQELVAEFCRRIAQGNSLRKVCRDDDMPNGDTIFAWLPKYPSFSEQYARATEERTEAMAEDVLDISDEVVADKDAVAKARLRVDTRKWLMSKMKPKKYGDKIEVEGTQEITHKYEDMNDEQLAAIITSRKN